LVQSEKPLNIEQVMQQLAVTR